MASVKVVTTFTALLALLLQVKAFSSPCIYQEYKCGFTLISSFGIIRFTLT
jgi:hypothetical protein